MHACFGFIIIIINPLTARVVGAPQVISQLVPGYFPKKNSKNKENAVNTVIRRD